MGNLRVYEVAKDLDVESEHLIELLHQMDVRVRSHMSTVTEAQIARLHARLERERRGGSEAVAENPPTAVRRRRRRAPVAEPVDEPENEAAPEVEEEVDEPAEVVAETEDDRYAGFQNQPDSALCRLCATRRTTL